jgi:Fic family protein
VGRLLIAFLLCERKVLQKPVLYLSHFFKQHRATYYDLLQGVREKGEWEEWIEFFLKGVAEVGDEATETARQILLLREDHRQRIAQNLGRTAGNGHIVLEDLFRHPITDVNRVQELIGTSYTAANNLVSGLERIGVLQETTGYARNRKFWYQDYITLFS